uniref:BTB domain-containing protein n=1 Tax=Timema genevievae TaxID=629358 RepID=A0A7R9PME3_TIMGE|nr:unnamed protein product [Timema genevievae]
MDVHGAILLILSSNFLSVLCQDITVTVAQGVLRGQSVTSSYGLTYNRFLGIPYAQPPVGDLRFKCHCWVMIGLTAAILVVKDSSCQKERNHFNLEVDCLGILSVCDHGQRSEWQIVYIQAPQEPVAWEGTRNATTYGSICAQRTTEDTVSGQVTSGSSIHQASISGSEDCLFMNIFTPQNSSSDDSLPVMVFIHGGAFEGGSGSNPSWGPEYFLEKGIVTVFINYRLNIIGFLSLEGTDVSGNAGLKDQVAALKWIKNNIASFGGDPNSVTIFGQSAGGSSIHYLVLSPMAKGLFHRAISQSGSAINPGAFHLNTQPYAFNLGAKLGLNTTDGQELATFLRAQPIEDLVNNLDGIVPEAAFVPTTEYPTAGEEAFLPLNPYTMLITGNFNKIPYITGSNLLEAAGFVGNDISMSLASYWEPISNDFERLVPLDLGLTKGSQQSKEVADKIKMFYFGNETLSFSSKDQYINLVTDEMFVCGIHETVKAQSASYENIYNYQFSFNKPSHSDEMQYLFYSGETYTPGEANYDVHNWLVNLWSSFAKTGRLPLTAQSPHIEPHQGTAGGEIKREGGKTLCARQREQDGGNTQIREFAKIEHTDLNQHSFVPWTRATQVSAQCGNEQLFHLSRRTGPFGDVVSARATLTLVRAVGAGTRPLFRLHLFFYLSSDTLRRFLFTPASVRTFIGKRFRNGDFYPFREKETLFECHPQPPAPLASQLPTRFLSTTPVSAEMSWMSSKENLKKVGRNTTSVEKNGQFCCEATFKVDIPVDRLKLDGKVTLEVRVAFGPRKKNTEICVTKEDAIKKELLLLNTDDSSKYERAKHLLLSGQCGACEFSVGLEVKTCKRASKVMLALKSPVFDRMFFGDFEEDAIIQVPDIEADVLDIMLKHIYGVKWAFESKEQTMDVFYAANKYMLPELMSVCIEYVWPIELDDVFIALNFSTLFSLEYLKEAAMIILKNNVWKILNHPEFVNLSQKSLLAIVELQHLNLNSELELFDAAVKWAKAQCNKNELLENGDNLRAVLGDVIRHIRFLTMTPSEVTGSPCESDVLTCEDKLILLRRYISMNTVTPSSNVCCLKKSREKV